MRRRITRALAATAAAGATITTLGFAAAGSAGAAVTAHKPHNITFAPSAPVVATDASCTQGATLTPADDCGMAGYVASHRDFRYAQATVTVPTSAASITTSPEMYVALDASGTANYNFVRVGVAPCVHGAAATAFIVPNQTVATSCSATAGQDWVAFAATEISGAVTAVTTYPINNLMGGQGVGVSAYEDPTGNVHTVIAIPTAGGTIIHHNTFAASGIVFTQAQALADWTMDQVNGGATPLPAPTGTGLSVRVTQFFQGAFTTVSGIHGTFSSPAWMLNALDATSNGVLPPGGTIYGEPSYLWNDGLGNGWGDAFGVWLRPF